MGRSESSEVKLGLLSSEADVAAAQRRAIRAAAVTEYPDQSIEDARELRYWALARSAVLWGVIGIPALLSAIAALLYLIGGALFASALDIPTP